MTWDLRLDFHSDFHEFPYPSHLHLTSPLEHLLVYIFTTLASLGSNNNHSTDIEILGNTSVIPNPKNGMTSLGVVAWRDSPEQMLLLEAISRPTIAR